MVLSDTDIRKRLPELQIATFDPNFPFKADQQVHSCSIDLRLSDIFWRPRGRAIIDLSDDGGLGDQVSDAFERRKLSYPKGYRLKPGAFVLGRTYEAFEIPGDLIGRLVGRSSFGRLGLSVAGQSNLINPGWRGHMPLIIVNTSPFDMILQPYVGIVQLCLLQLSTAARVPYRDGTESKYIDDDGGPSRYWLDRSIVELRESANVKKVNPEAQSFLERYSAELDEPTRRAFSKHVRRAGTITDVRYLTDDFARAQGVRNAAIAAAALTVASLLTIVGTVVSLLWDAGAVVRVVLGFATLVVMALVGWAVWMQFRGTMPPSELRRIASDLRKEADHHS